MPKILTTGSAKHFGLPSGEMRVGRFPGGEISLTIKENLNGENVFIIGSTNAPGDNLIELFLAIDTASRLGAKKVSAVIPYFAYARADREKFPGDAISAGTMAKMFESVGGSNFEVITFDIHSPRLQSFFKCPFKNVDVSGVFEKIIKDHPGLTIVAPDKGAEIKAFEFAKKLGLTNNSVLQKERLEDGTVEIKCIAGEVGKKVLMLDDIIDSGGTILKGAEFLKAHGADEIFVAATHMVWQGGGYKKLAESQLIKKIYTTDTIAPPSEIPTKIEVLSVTPNLKQILLLS